MSREQHRIAAENLALRLLAESRDWTCPVALAKQHGHDWRILARALRRLANAGTVKFRDTERKDQKSRIRKRREYRLSVTSPLLVTAHKFDPSSFKVVGVRVIRIE